MKKNTFKFWLANRFMWILYIWSLTLLVTSNIKTQASLFVVFVAFLSALATFVYVEENCNPQEFLFIKKIRNFFANFDNF